MSHINFLTQRVSFPRLTTPAPTPEQLTKMFEAACRAPDHKQLRPWRFLVVTGEARKTLGEVMARADGLTDNDENWQKSSERLLRAPLIIVAITVFKEHEKVPRVEQVLSTGAAANNILLAADALGFGGIWRTGDAAFSEEVAKALRLKANEQMAGFIYIGTPDVRRKSIRGENLDALVQRWDG